MPIFCRADNLARQSGVSHGFFSRHGGVSRGIYATLNCGPSSGDARTAVFENRRIAIDALASGAQLATLHQIHSALALRVTAAWPAGEAPRADAMATNLRNVALGVLTADCAPVLFADAAGGVIGVAHAGWNGALAGVIESALEAMEGLGARRTRIAAAIGPTIGQENYEVGPEFRDRFVQAERANSRFFVTGERSEHWRFDLESYVTMRLERAGVRNVSRVSQCTYAHKSDFFSYRRATHNRELDYGRQLSAIALTP